MSDLDVHPDLVPASEWHDPVKVRPEDLEALREIQVYVDALNKYRQEIGRLYQALNNLRDKADETELELANKRRALVSRYNLEAIGDGQWAIDFEKKEFVRISDKAPVIP